MLKKKMIKQSRFERTDHLEIESSLGRASAGGSSAPLTKWAPLTKEWA